MRLFSKFCSKTLTEAGSLRALNVTVSVWILLETSVKYKTDSP